MRELGSRSLIKVSGEQLSLEVHQFSLMAVHQFSLVVVHQFTMIVALAGEGDTGFCPLHDGRQLQLRYQKQGSFSAMG